MNSRSTILQICEFAHRAESVAVSRFNDRFDRQCNWDPRLHRLSPRKSVDRFNLLSRIAQ